MTEKYDAIIIGAGVIGSCIGFELAKLGYKTLNIDKQPAAGHGSTGNSCAVIRLSYSTYVGVALAYEGYHIWKDWDNYLGAPDELGRPVFKETGCMIIKSEINDNLAGICRCLDEAGVAYENWDADRIKARAPYFDLKKFAPMKRPEDPEFGASSGEVINGAIYYDQAGYINDPTLTCHNVQRAAEANGGRFLFNRTVTEIKHEDNKVQGVALDDGTVIEAPVVVNAAGPHSSKINRLAGIEDKMKIKTRALRREVAHVRAPQGVDMDNEGFVAADDDIGDYIRPEVGNNILIGSVEPACDEKTWVDPDDYNPNLGDQWTAQVYRLALRIPSLGIPNLPQGVVDLYDVSDDWIPIYDRSDLEGFYLAIGTSGNQFKTAPVAGRIMAEIIDACRKGRDHDRDPVVVKLPYIGVEIDTGSFSRNREVNADSSFTVMG